MIVERSFSSLHDQDQRRGTYKGGRKLPTWLQINIDDQRRKVWKEVMQSQCSLSQISLVTSGPQLAVTFSAISLISRLLVKMSASFSADQMRTAPHCSVNSQQMRYRHIKSTASAIGPCLPISINDAVSDGSAKTLFLNIERAIMNCPKEFEPDVLNTFSTTWVRQILYSRRVHLPLPVLQLFFSLLSLIFQFPFCFLHGDHFPLVWSGLSLIALLTSLYLSSTPFVPHKASRQLLALFLFFFFFLFFSFFASTRSLLDFSAHQHLDPLIFQILKANLSSILSPKGQTFHQFLSFTWSINVCSLFVSTVIRSLRKVVC